MLGTKNLQFIILASNIFYLKKYSFLKMCFGSSEKQIYRYIVLSIIN